MGKLGAMTVLADEVVKGYRVVTYHSIYSDKMMAQMPWRTEVVAPGQQLPLHGTDHASMKEALRAHQEKIDELRRKGEC
jgi:hypothetical protein